MEKFEQWLVSHRLSVLYLNANGTGLENISVLTARVFRGGEPAEYALEFTREMMNLYEAMEGIENDRVIIIDELISQNEKLMRENSAYKKLVKTLLLEEEDE